MHTALSVLLPNPSSEVVIIFFQTGHLTARPMAIPMIGGIATTSPCTASFAETHSFL
jgi:hypothetical protein